MKKIVVLDGITLGNVDFDKAKANFETAIKERYPEISEVKWPE